MILFIGAHTDDIELSCGGTLHKYIKQGEQVFCAALSYCDNSLLIDEMNNSMSIIGCINSEVNEFERRTFPNQRQAILDYLIELKQTLKPDLIFTHHPDDIHQDHATVGSESIRAFRGIPINFYMHPFNGIIKPTLYCDLGEENMGIKLNSLNQYHTQQHRQYMSKEAVYGVAVASGLHVGVKYAELFHGMAHKI